jgi:hypothetical protein
MLSPRTKVGVLVPSTLLLVFSVVSCRDESASPTAPGSASVMGTVINGDDPAGSALAGVNVRVLRTGQAVQTDAGGNFTITGVPAGDQQFQFSRGDIDARATISVSSGATVAVTAAISKRKTVLISPRGPNLPAQTPPPGTITPCGKGETQIEGIVTGNSGGTLTIFQEGHGTFTVTVTAETTIRKGETPVAIGDILVGWRVHVKALCDCSGNCTAVEIIVQNQNTVTPSTGTPTAAATNTPTVALTNTPTGTPTVGTPTATNTPSNTPTNTGTNTPTNTGTNTPTNTGTNTPTSTSTPLTPTVTPSATPTLTPTT